MTYSKGKTGKEIDYRSVSLKEGKDRKKYDYVERRSYLLMLSMAHGTLEGLPTCKLAVELGVTPGQITQDKHALRHFIRREYKQPDVLESEAILAKRLALRGAIESRDWKAVNTISNDLLSMGFDLGALDKTPQKIELHGEPVQFVWESSEEPKKKAKKTTKKKAKKKNDKTTKSKKAKRT